MPACNCDPQQQEVQTQEHEQREPKHNMISGSGKGGRLVSRGNNQDMQVGCRQAGLRTVVTFEVSRKI
jgi:phosphosulfolactate phosphohydrolase-like enzyme